MIIVAVVAISVIIGAVRGFVREAVALITWLVAIWVAWRFSGFLHPYLGGLLETPEQKAWVARGIVLLVVLLVGTLVGALLSWLTRTAAGLSAFDRLFGVLFGLTRGIVLVGFGALLGQTLKLDHEPWWKHSRLVPYAQGVAGWLESFAGESRHLAHRALDAREARGGEGQA
ncbi:MAG TPA: CvpA family protein [Steroidobacteraceae bacterium]|nr:CvpA family protein [Steroidobacteraceae bacterium]